MNKQELNELFEKRITSIKEEKQNRRKRIYEVNKRYADAFLKLVITTLNNTKDLYREEEIKYTSSIIGTFNAPDSEKKSTAIINDDSLEIVLYFNSNPYKVPNREKEYDEITINNILKQYNISIKTINPTPEDIHQHILIRYTYQKEKEYSHYEYKDHKEITNEEACHIISLINLLNKLNIKDRVTLDAPKEERSIYLFKNETGSWTICNARAYFGLDSPQFCDDIKRAIQEVLTRLKLSKEEVELYKSILKEESLLNQEAFLNTYGYKLTQNKRLN